MICTFCQYTGYSPDELLDGMNVFPMSILDDVEEKIQSYRCKAAK